MDSEQQLFLLEFLVDEVTIPIVRAMHEELLPASTCVSFQILNMPVLSIYQDGPTDGCACNETDRETFRKGKSCLFALPTIVLQKPLTSFPVTMSVYKKLPPGVLPDVMLIGSHRIELKDLVNGLLRDRAFQQGNPCRSIKETYRISTATGQSVGEATVFIRGSSFGKKIVTQFQMPHNRKPYLFKGAEDGPVFQCKRIPSDADAMKVRCICPPKKTTDGSGEAAPPRNCCQMPTGQQVKSSVSGRRLKGGEFRPCCPAGQSPTGSPDYGRCLPCASNRRGAQQVQPRVNCPPERDQHSKSSGCCTTRYQKDSCSPCCGAQTSSSSSSPFGTKGYKAFGDTLSKEPAVRRCGCTVKEQQKCSCSRT